MLQKTVKPGKALPPWVLVAGSVAIVIHLGILGLHALAAPSGDRKSVV